MERVIAIMARRRMKRYQSLENRLAALEDL